MEERENFHPVFRELTEFAQSQRLVKCLFFLVPENVLRVFRLSQVISLSATGEGNFLKFLLPSRDVRLREV